MPSFDPNYIIICNAGKGPITQSEAPTIQSLTQVFAKSRLLESSKGSGYIGLVVSVDKHRPSLQLVTHMQCLVSVWSVGSEREK